MIAHCHTTCYPTANGLQAIAYHVGYMLATDPHTQYPPTIVRCSTTYNAAIDHCSADAHGRRTYYLVRIHESKIVSIDAVDSDSL